MANLEVDPADGTLERSWWPSAACTAVTNPRVLAAAGASGALVATVVVARAVATAVQTRRHPARRRLISGRLRLPSLPVPTALARAK